MSITNDKEFKAALVRLPISHQRNLAAAFVRRLVEAATDVRIRAALDVAARTDVSDAELSVVSAAANSARVESFTQCGKETDWSAQAGHFIAKAACAAVRSAEEGDNLAWEAAMQVRMARTCLTVADGEGTDTTEAAEQYRILADFLNS